ncbi:MAG: hypothetical protein EPGJADBJ_00149 [Saprospiraceae bacterium]|nr:hypothetical protein [Saprospiraceae bacterium]
MTFESGLVNPSSFVLNGAVAFSHELPPTITLGGGLSGAVGSPRLVQCEQTYHVHFNWTVSGALVPLMRPDLRWKVEVYFERWGASEYGLPAAINPQTVGFVPVSGHTYSAIITIPGNTIPEGVYDMVAILRMYDAAGNPLPVAGFEEMNKVQFYEGR